MITNIQRKINSICSTYEHSNEILASRKWLQFCIYLKRSKTDMLVKYDCNENMYLNLKKTVSSLTQWDQWRICMNGAHYTWTTMGPYVFLTWSSNISHTHALLLLVRWRFFALSRTRVHLIKAWVLWSSSNFRWIKFFTISLKTNLKKKYLMDDINVIFWQKLFVL